jgi:hypothetical protein
MRRDHILAPDPFVELASFDPFFMAVVQFVTSGRPRGWLSSFRSSVPGCCAENSVHACGAAIGPVALGVAAVVTGWAALTVSMASFRGVAADDAQHREVSWSSRTIFQRSEETDHGVDLVRISTRRAESKSAQGRRSQHRKDFLVNVVSLGARQP